jgi:hypothetical protein
VPYLHGESWFPVGTSFGQSPLSGYTGDNVRGKVL